MQTKLELVKDFLDIVYIEFKKSLYHYFRNCEHKTPIDILKEFDWNTRKESYLEFSSFEDIFYIEDVIYDFEKNHYFIENYSINYGGEQIAFIFQNDVIKATLSNAPYGVQELKEFLGEYGNFISETNIIEVYHNATIYSQPRAILEPEDIHTDKTVKVYSSMIEDEVLCQYIQKELGYDEDKIKDFYNRLEEFGFCFDLHEENWGLVDNKVSIFDPVFCYC